MNEKKAIPFLEDTTYDPRALETSCRSVQRQPTGQLIPRLLLALQVDAGGLRHVAAESLIRLGLKSWPHPLPPLMDRQKGENPCLRRSADHIFRYSLVEPKVTAPHLRELEGLPSAGISALMEADPFFFRMANTDAFASRVAAVRQEKSATRPAPATTQTMRLALNADVQCADGRAGHSRLVFIRPVRRQVTHVVVEEKCYPYNAHLVPLDLIQESNHKTIKLRCTRRELADQKLFIELGHLREGLSYLSYPPMGYAPWSYFSTAERSVMPLGYDTTPQGEFMVNRDTRAQATDGQAGRVNELWVNAQTGNITDLVLRQGHLWFQEDVTISVADIDHIAEDTVYLKLDKRAVEALPVEPVTQWLS